MLYVSNKETTLLIHSKRKNSLIYKNNKKSVKVYSMLLAVVVFCLLVNYSQIVGFVSIVIEMFQP